MFKYLKNNRGVALLSVMAIMTVLVIIGSLALYMASSESRMVNNYGDNVRANYIAEAGADLVIQQWKLYIADTDNISSDKIDIVDFLTDPNNGLDVSMDNLESSLMGSEGYNVGNSAVSINYESTPSSGQLPVTTTNEPASTSIVINVTGDYSSTQYTYRVQLWFTTDGNNNYFPGSEKGDGSGVTSVPLSSAKDIISFTLAAQTGPAAIDTSAHSVTVQVNSGANLTSLAPAITVSPNATISPASGEARDFTGTVIYTVTAQDGSTQQWTVTVTKANQEVPEDRPFPWVDMNGNNKFDSGIDIQLTVSQIKNNYSTNGKLVIPPSVGNLNVGNNAINYNANGGIYVGVSLSNQSYNSISLNSGSGDVTIASGMALEPTNDISINALNIYASGAKFYSSSNGKIQLNAGAAIDVSSATIVSSNYIDVESQGAINAQNSKITSSSNGLVALKTLSNGSDITLSQTILNSSGKVDIKSQGALYANNASITSHAFAGTILQALNDIQLTGTDLPANGPLNISSQGGNLIADSSSMSSTGWTDVNLTSGGDISVKSATINAAKDIIFNAGNTVNTIYVNNSQLRDKNNVAQGLPAGVHINGTPAFGAITNQ